MPRARKPKQAPSETYAARAARGRPMVSMSLPQETIAALDALAERWETTRSGAVVRLVEEQKTDVCRI